MRYLVIATLGMMLLVTAAVVSLPYMAGGEFVTQHLQQAVARATGRTLTVLKAPVVSVFPDAAVTVEGVSLSNPEGMFNGTTASIERLEARISLWQLLSRKPDIEQLTLVRPRLTLVIDKAGKANWQLPEMASSGGSVSDAAGGKSVAIAPVRIINGEINFTDERTGASFRAEAVNATVSVPIGSEPFKADGTLKWNGETVNVNLFVKDVSRLAQDGSPVEVALQARPMQAAVSGRMKLSSGFDLAGQVDMNASDLRKVAAWGGWKTEPGSGLKDVSVRGALSITGSRATLEDATVKMDGMTGNGLVRVLASAGRPRIEASLGIPRLDLNVYTSGPTDAAAGAKTASGWSDREISLGGLNRADATLRLRVNEIIYGKLTKKDASLDAKLDNGKLAATLQTLTLYGAQANGTLEIDGSQNVPRLAGKLTASGADAQTMLRDFAGIEQIAGTANVALDLAAAGRSQAEMVSTLSGTARLAIGQGTLQGIDIPALVNGVQISILDGWSQAGSGNTPFDRLSADFALADGIAETRELKVEGAGLEVSGAGKADILRRKLEFRVSPRVASGDGNGMTSIPVPVVISGPWASPRIYPDVDGILEDPQSAFDTLGKLGVNVEAAGKSLRKEAEKLLGTDGAKEAEELGGKLLNKLLKQGD